jgi:hypothetical protein
MKAAWLLRTIAEVAALAWCRCSMAPVAGAGSETTNSLTGTLVRQGGLVSAADVRLFPADYDCVKQMPFARIRRDTTDSRGAYRFEGLDSGRYTLIATALSDGKRAMVSGIHIRGADSIGADTLVVPGTIKIPRPAGFDSSFGYVFIPGTNLYAALPEGSDTITLDSVPAGIVPLVAYSSKASAAPPQTIGDSLVVPRGGSVTLAYQTFATVKKVYLNTTSSGANVAANVLDFPVCVRLTRQNFDFGRVRKDGSDIRFAKSNGMPLSYEIETWDSAGGNAAVWVRLDTVYGGDTSQYFQMYWGDPAAVAASNSEAVFDTSKGYLGVWHQGPGLADACIYGDGGIDSATTDTAGVVGRCRRFDPHRRGFIAIPNPSRFDVTDHFTLFAWVLVDTINVTWETILAKGDNAYRLHCDSSTGQACFSITTADTVDYGYKDLRGTTPLTDHAWHLICGEFNGTSMQTFVDGSRQAATDVSMQCLTDTSSLIIGNNGPRSPRFFAGAIDEVRVLRTAASPDWIKLCYMNQKPHDALVVFR